MLGWTCVATMVVFTAPFVHLPLIAPHLSKDLDISIPDWGLAWSILQLGTMLFLAPAAFMVERYGKLASAAGMAVIGGMLLMRAHVDSYVSLIATLLVQGMAQSILFVGAMTIVQRWFPVRQLGLAVGMLSTAVAATSALVQWLTPALVGSLGGWRALSKHLALCNFSMIVPWMLFIADPPAATVSERNVPHAIKALIGLAKNRKLLLLGLCGFFVRGTVSGSLAYWPSYFLRTGAGTRLTIGALVSTAAWGGMVGGLVLPILSDRLGRSKVFVVAASVFALGILMSSTLTGTALRLTLAAAGFASSLSSLIIVSAFEHAETNAAQAGLIIGFVDALSELGGVVQPFLGMSLDSLNPLLCFVYWAAGAATAAVIFIYLATSRDRVLRDFEVAVASPPPQSREA